MRSITVLVTGDDALNQLLNGGDKAVFVEWILAKFEGVMTRKHKALIQITAMGGQLQSRLDAKRSRISALTGGTFFVVGPIGKAALA